MAYKIKINNVVYDLKDDFTIKDELNETLDSAIVSFNIYGSEANFECFDSAQIYDSENKIEPKYFLVDSYDDEIHSFGANFESDDHTYSVTFFSETKELERITLPNYTITQTKDLHRSVWWQISRVCSLYVPRIKVFEYHANNHYKYVRKFTLDPALKTRFNNIECPEMQWNNPTLREVLNDLVSVDDCIIVVKQGVISFYDLKQRGNPIDVSKLSFSKKTMSSQDYAGELTIDMQNAIGHNDTITCENLSLRAPEGEISLTTENGIIPTMQPIYALKKLRVRFPTERSVQFAPTTSYYGWEDITDRVLEKEEFDLLSNVAVNSTAYDNLPTFTDSNGVTTKKHKVHFLYYERGKKGIFNFSTPYGENFWTNPSSSTSFVKKTMSAIASVHAIDGNEYLVGGDPRNAFAFDVEYESLAQHSLKVGKYLPSKHPENRIFDNQDNSYVDLEHQSVYEYAKVNRLGHKLRTIQGEYASENEIPKLSDYIGDEILFSREITYRDNLFLFKGLLMPNYVLKNFFTGVKAKKRSWQIAKNEDALTRHDIYKLYVEASFSEKIDEFNYSDADGIKSLTSFIGQLVPLTKNNTTPYYTLGGCMVQTRKSDTYYPNETNAILVDSESSIEGYSICLNFGFDDNHISAHYIRKEGDERLQNFYRYTNSYGEADEMTVILHNAQIKSGYSRSGPVDEDYYSSLQNTSFVLPRISKTSNYYGSAIGTFVLNLRKDNREIIKTTLQFEYCSDTADIIITKKFLERHPWFSRTTYNANSEKIYLSNEKYSINDTEVKGELSNATIDQFELTAAGMVVHASLASGEIPEGTKSWGITDENGKLLVGVNFKDEETPDMRIYFNFLRSRDDKIYLDNYSGIVLGDITPQGISEAVENYSEQIPDVTNTIWKFNEICNRFTYTIDSVTYTTNKTFNINFKLNNSSHYSIYVPYDTTLWGEYATIFFDFSQPMYLKTYDYIYTHYNLTEGEGWYIYVNGSYVKMDEPPTIEITGGRDIDDIDFNNWLTENAVKQETVTIQGRIARRGHTIATNEQSAEIDDGTGNEQFDDENE